MSVMRNNGDFQLIEKGGDFIEKVLPLAYKKLDGPNVNGFYVPHELYMNMLDEIPEGTFITDVADATDGKPNVVKLEHIIGRIISIDKENLTAKVKLLKGKYVGSLDDAVLGISMMAYHDEELTNKNGYITANKVTPKHGHLLYGKLTAYKRKMETNEKEEVEK